MSSRMIAVSLLISNLDAILTKLDVAVMNGMLMWTGYSNGSLTRCSNNGSQSYVTHRQ